MLYTYTATVRSLTEEKIITATDLRSLAAQLGVSFFTAMNVVNKKENCLARKWVTIDRIPRPLKGPPKKPKKEAIFQST